MNTVGKKNILFGLSYFLTTLGLGIYLGSKLDQGDPTWLDSSAHHLLATAHAHGNLESLLNIVLGFLLCRLAVQGTKLPELISGLLLFGAVFHSGMLYLAGLGIPIALKLAPVGAFAIIFGIALMIPIVSRGISEIC